MDVLDTVFKRLSMAVIQRAGLGRVHEVVKPLIFEQSRLRLVPDGKVRRLHADVILAAEFAVVSHPAHLETARAHVREPPDHVSVICDLVVCHVQPVVVEPAEQRYLVLLCLYERSRTWEPAVRDDDVHALVVAEQARCGEVMQL